MIKSLINRVFGGARRGKPHEPRIYRRDQHGIPRSELSEAAIRTCEGLHRAGYQAFVVGGAVRDLLLGRHPKDFDVATDATPEDVRRVFRRSRIIGRRFRLVHVLFGAETIEVSTFRAGHNARDEETGHADEHGRLLRDNVFGNQQEDALRRDFTMNALFYDPEREEIWDYTDGVKDVEKKRVVMIGDPAARYREDPVRMLRAARLAGKLGFAIDKKTEEPIRQLAPLLDNVPESRLFDEMLKLLLSGHALDCIERLRALGLAGRILPALDRLLGDPAHRRFAELVLTRTDERIQSDRSVSPAFLFAALFWPLMETRRQALEASGEHPIAAWHRAMDEVLDAQRQTLAIPRRFDGNIKELWLAQPRFAQRSRGKVFRMLTHPRFRACYDFYALRAEAGDADLAIAAWWESFQTADEASREAMLLPDEGPKKKRRRRGGHGRGRPADDASTETVASSGDDS